MRAVSGRTGQLLSPRTTCSAISPTAAMPSWSRCRPPMPFRCRTAIDFTTAAAFPLSFLTAWHMLHTRARLVDGETVLVVAAGSGVGQAAVQLAQAAGARVIATAAERRKGGDGRRSIGADDVIDHHHDDVVARVRELTAAAAWTSCRTRRRRDMGAKRAVARARRAARHVRRHDRPRCDARSAAPLRPAVVVSWVVHGRQTGAAARRRAFLPGGRSGLSSIGRSRCPKPRRPIATSKRRHSLARSC